MNASVMTRQQKAEAVRVMLRADWRTPDRQIAAEVGASPTTVGKQRLGRWG